jgi:hypothetical protein
MQAGIKRRYRPPVHPSRGHSHNRKSFCGTALLVARRSTLRQVGLLPPIALNVSLFLSIWQGLPIPGRVGGGVCPEEPRGSDVRGGKI